MSSSRNSIAAIHQGASRGSGPRFDEPPPTSRTEASHPASPRTPCARATSRMRRPVLGKTPHRDGRRRGLLTGRFPVDRAATAPPAEIHSFMSGDRSRQRAHLAARPDRAVSEPPAGRHRTGRGQQPATGRPLGTARASATALGNLQQRHNIELAATANSMLCRPSHQHPGLTL